MKPKRFDNNKKRIKKELKKINILYIPVFCDNYYRCRWRRMGNDNK